MRIPKIWLEPIQGYDPWKSPHGCRFDVKVAKRVVDFFEKNFTHSKGEFAGKNFKLEKWQKQIIGHTFAWKRPDGTRRYRKLFVYVPRKNGKMMELNTPVPTLSGWKTMGTLICGDTVFDKDGNQAKVKLIHPIENNPESYIITFSNGEKVKACADHQWLIHSRLQHPKYSNKTQNVNRKYGCKTVINSIGHDVYEDIWTTKQMFNIGIYRKNIGNIFSVPMPKPIMTNECELPVPPYAFGVWLGDGDSAGSGITCSDKDVDIIKFMEIDGVECRRVKQDSKKTPRYRMGNGNRTQKERNQSWQAKLRALGVLNNKHIPRVYLRASVKQRIELLQGLMDTDGTISKRGTDITFCNKNKTLIDGVSELLASLGIKHSIRNTIKKCQNGFNGMYYQIQFCAYRDELEAFRLKRKLDRMLISGNGRSRKTQIISIEKTNFVPMRCITVDSPSGTYLFGKTMIPTHNTTLVAAIGLLLFTADNEPGAEIYCCAADTDQASLVFKEASSMVRQNADLDEEIRIFDGYKAMKFEATGSYWKVLSSEAGTKHGLNPHAYIIDEVHAQRKSELMEVLETGVGARRQPLGVYLTTADYSGDSPCNRMVDYARKVRDGGVDDYELFPVLYEALADKDDWKNESVWWKSNPNLGVSLKIDYLRAQFRKALEEPSFENTFKRLHLNMQTEQERRWLKMEDWDSSGCVIDKADLLGQECFGGLDLSSSQDITAFVLYFPKQCACLPFFWVPENTAKKKIEYEVWARDGYVKITTGRVINYEMVRADINELRKLYNIVDTGYDPWNASQMAKQLADDDGMKMMEFRQGYKSMNEPSKEFEKLVIQRRLAHLGNPVLRWMASNVQVAEDPAGNIKPTKAQKDSPRKIDGIVGLVMAVGLSMTVGNESKSVYEEREMIIL